MITDYQSLQDSVANWADRTDLTDEIKECIQLSEAHMRQSMRVHWMETTDTLSVLSGDSTVALPADFNGMRSIRLDASGANVLEQVAPTVLHNQYASTVSGRPQVYAIVNEQIEFAPAADNDYDLILDYYKFDPISDTNTKSDVLTRYPNLYLYLSLANVAMLMRDDTRMGVWQSKAEALLNNIEEDDSSVRWGNSPLGTRCI